MTEDASFPRLVSLACHDVRTPLATVFGFARMIERWSQGLPVAHLPAVPD